MNRIYKESIVINDIKYWLGVILFAYCSSCGWRDPVDVPKENRSTEREHSESSRKQTVQSRSKEQFVEQKKVKIEAKIAAFKSYTTRTSHLGEDNLFGHEVSVLKIQIISPEKFRGPELEFYLGDYHGVEENNPALKVGNRFTFEIFLGDSMENERSVKSMMDSLGIDWPVKP